MTTLDLEVQAEGFELRLHADRPPGEILAGLLGCHLELFVRGQLETLAQQLGWFQESGPQEGELP